MTKDWEERNYQQTKGTIPGGFLFPKTGIIRRTI